MKRISKLKKLTHLRLVSDDTNLFEHINKNNQAQIAAANRLESLRVLILEICINPPKFSIFNLAYPNLKQLYLDRSCIVCLCESAPQRRRVGRDGNEPLEPIPRLQSTIDSYKLLKQSTTYFAYHTSKHSLDCHTCLRHLIKVLNEFAHMPKIDPESLAVKFCFSPKLEQLFKKMNQLFERED